MARPRKPANVIEITGRSHMSKDELQKRKNSEVRAAADNVRPPGYLSDEQQQEFQQLADELTRIEIMTNLDCDALARFVIARAQYIKFTQLVDNLPAEIETLKLLESAVGLQDKAFKQCRAAASDLGLTISSRCKLVVPKLPEEKPKNKFREMSG